MTTREALLAEAAKKHWRIFSLILENYSHEQARMEADKAFRAGATWEAQRSAVLLEALEKIASGDFPATGWNIFVAEQIAREALSSYRAKRGGE